MRGSHDVRLREAADFRTTLHSSKLSLVEDWAASAHAPPQSGYLTSYQLVLPYFGLVSYSLRNESWLCDSNRTLFLSPGSEFSTAHPVSSVGHASILITPSRDFVHEVWGDLRNKKGQNFLQLSRPSTMRLGLLVHQLRGFHAWMDGTTCKDEWVVQTLFEAIGQQPSSRGSPKLVDRAKEILHAKSCERLRLEEIAREVGVTPVYLTQEFSRREGVPLYRYQIRLRLHRSLLELPHCEDITGLALDLGFSSHSHFTSIFRKTFGLTPSEYRSSTVSHRRRSRILMPIEGFAATARRAA